MRIKEFRTLYRGNDDNFVNYIRDLLNRQNPGCILTIAREQASFTAEVKENRTDLFLLDTDLAGYDPVQTIEFIRMISPESTIQVITPAIEPISASLCFRAGANDVLSKTDYCGPHCALERTLINYFRQEKQKSMNRLKDSILHITEKALAVEKIGEFYKILQDDLFPLLEIKNIILGIYNPLRHSIRIPAIMDAFDKFNEVSIGRTYSEIVIRSGTTLHLRGTELDEYEERYKLSRKGAPAKDWLGIPLKSHDKIIGILISQSYDEELFFTPEDIEVLEYMARLLAHFIYQKELETDLRRFSRAINQINSAVMITDTEGHIEFVNPAFCDTTGYTSEEVLGKNPKILKSGETDPRLYAELWDKIKNGGKWQGVLRNKKKNGELFWENMKINPMKDLAGQIISFVAIMEDITRQKNVENQILTLNQRNQQLLDSIRTGLIVLDSDEQVIQWNTVSERLFGIPAETALNKQLLSLGILWDWALVATLILNSREKNTTGEVLNIPFERPDKRTGFLNIFISPFSSGSAGKPGFLIQVEDISERIILENQLHQAQKLESIGQLAAGIAHEINTPIQFIGDNLHFLQDSFKSLIPLFEDQNIAGFLEENNTGIDLNFLSAEIPAALDQSLDGIKRVTKIVKALKEFSHPSGEEKKEINLNHTIRNTLIVARNEFKYVAALVTDFDPALTTIACYVDDFNQVVLNLIINAVYAIEEKNKSHPGQLGTITIRTKKSGSTAVISIADSGTGIPENIRQKIFDPFFTTKEVGRGTGQGLSIAHDVIVNKHHGTIRFETEPGEGTTFIITLPLE